jgi:hypothetical protein
MLNSTFGQDGWKHVHIEWTGTTFIKSLVDVANIYACPKVHCECEAMEKEWLLENDIWCTLI